MRPEPPLTLRSVLLNAAGSHARAFHGGDGSIGMETLARSPLGPGAVAAVAGHTVMLAFSDQSTAAAALIALDGLAARMLICPPGLPPAHRDAVAEKAEVDIVVDDAWWRTATIGTGDPVDETPSCATQWLLLTSGTTGVPKIVAHTLRGLTGAIIDAPVPGIVPTWATMYDIRRYGGMQIFLRAVLGTGSMVLPGADEPFAEYLARCGARGVTHMSGTPSHWRRVLMSPAATAIAPAYVRLSGEIADQAVLDALARKFPHAKIGHAYASTEAGVGFDVNDGREGFPATYVGSDTGPVAMKVVDGTLRIRSARTATDYVGEAGALRDADGFVDTGDAVVLDGDRYRFAGRRGGIINIGGQKVHPEEIEAVINRHGAVRMSLVKSRKNPITGALVSAEVVLDEAGGKADSETIRREIERACRDKLAAWKVPATIRFVPALPLTAAGKLARADA